MNDLRKVLVIDNGRRGEDDLLSVELAGLGVSSVTTSLEAADQVLGVIERPSAIFVRMPSGRTSSDEAEFLALAEEFRHSDRTSGVPVILWDPRTQSPAGGISAILRAEVGPTALAEPEL